MTFTSSQGISFGNNCGFLVAKDLSKRGFPSRKFGVFLSIKWVLLGVCLGVFFRISFYTPKRYF